MKNVQVLRKPLIAVTARTEVHDDIKWISIPESYMEAIRLAQGIPVIVDQLDDVELFADRFDALLLPGGEDLNPTYYQQEKTSSEPLMEHRIDELDLQMIHAFHVRSKPILGICRGMQCINVAFGGSLCQDIPTTYLQAKKAHDQRQQVPVMEYEDTSCHEVFCEPHTQLHTLFGPSYRVNSFHHQCIDRLADGFIASAFASDGIIEGIEQQLIIGVQWHPEWLMRDGKSLGLFRSFVDQARKQMEAHG